MMVEGENTGLRSLPYDSVELTPQEVEAALLEARKKKWFHVKHADYWENLESKKGKTKVMSYLSHTEKKEYNETSISPGPGHGFRS